MSQEEVLKTLRNLGLTSLDSKIYIYLSKKGPQKGNEIAKALKVQKQQLYRSLKSLQRKAVASATLEHPARFCAVPFENVLDLFIKTKLEEAQIVQAEKTRLLSSWQAMQTAEVPDPLARFMVIEGKNVVYSRIKQMIDATQKQLSVVSTVSGLARADQFGLLGAGFGRRLRSQVRFRLLTSLSKENVGVMQALLKEMPKVDMRFEIRNPTVGSSVFPRMVIRDQEEAIFFINPDADESLPERDSLCLWTDCKSLVRSFSAMFEELWRNSTDIEKKIAEVETGKPTPKTFVINEAEEVKKKHREILRLARQSIVVLTSSNGLVEACKDLSRLRNWIEKGVSVKFMAPVVKENWLEAKQLSKICQIKHVPINYLETMIVDGKHLFHFKRSFSEQENASPISRFDNSSYTNDTEWVGKIRATLDDIWKNAQIPSEATLESFSGSLVQPVFPVPAGNLPFCKKLGFGVADFKPPGTLTEKNILDKVIHGKKLVCKDPSRYKSRAYGSFAIGVIHPPSEFNLPDMMIHVWKVEKQSSFGEENVMTVYLWLETQKGYAFVPVAVAGDNPKAQAIRRVSSAGTPLERNSQFYGKDKLQVSLHGNTLFAGWTVPIPLYPPSYILPPSCILFEGHGNVRPTGYTSIAPSGVKFEMEDNAFDAFVTFVHPASKYSGPSTDGLLIRDSVMTTIPSPRCVLKE